jgi:hypothetical protein
MKKQFRKSFVLIVTMEYQNGQAHNRTRCADFNPPDPM